MENDNKMNFGNFFNTIVDAKIEGNGNVAQFVIRTFKYAGTHKDVKENTVRSWLSGYRNCPFYAYFPDDTFDKEGFMKFFSKRMGVPWQKLQDAFRQKFDESEPKYENFVVNIVTNNPDIFFRSLLNQFLTIFNLPVTDVPEELEELEVPESDNPSEGTADSLPISCFMSDAEKIRQMRPMLAKLLEMERGDYFRRNISVRIPCALLDCMKEVYIKIKDTIFFGEEVREAIKIFEMKYHDYTEYVEKHTCKTENSSFKRILPIPPRNGVQMKDYGGVAYERVQNEIKQRKMELLQAVYKIDRLGDEER